jgi:adenosine deaminase
VNRAAPPGAAAAAAALARAWSSIRAALPPSGAARAGGSRIVVGLDVSGDPTRGTLAPLLAALEPARAAGLGVAVHAAEVLNVAETESVLSWGAQRLGHVAVLAHGTEARLLAAAAGASANASASAASPTAPPLRAAPRAPAPPGALAPIPPVKRLGGLSGPPPIEICPTSNALTLHLPALWHHPTLHTWLAAGYPLSIATDDPGVFGVTLSDELAAVAEAAALDGDTLAALALGAFTQTFADEEDAAAL